MRTPRFKIRSVDSNGFCGRDYHPTPSDIGRVVVPFQMRTWYLDADGAEHEVTPRRVADEGVPGCAGAHHVRRFIETQAQDAQAAGEDGILIVYTCLVVGTSRVLELLDFELEAI